MQKLLRELVGRRVTGLSVSDDAHILAFDTPDGGAIAFYAEGDCCSESWFADITGVSCLLGREVRAAEERDMSDCNVDDGRTRQEFDSAYGFTLSTDAGRCDVIFRCSSNGYYGGWMERYKRPLPPGMRPITDDWQA